MLSGMPWLRVPERYGATSSSSLSFRIKILREKWVSDIASKHNAIISLNWSSFYRVCVSVCVCVHMCTHASMHTQLRLALWDPMDCNPTGSSVHGIPWARILEWVAISFSRGSSQFRDQTKSHAVAGGFFTNEPPGKPISTGDARAKLF